MVAWNRDYPWTWPEAEVETVERLESCRPFASLADRHGRRRAGPPNAYELAATLAAMDQSIGGGLPLE